MTGTDTEDAARRPAPPIAMLAELTHRCPLACPYCSNPLELTRRDDELTTDEWIDVFAQAAALGVLHVHLSGGEPAARRDLATLTQAASAGGLYTNLITSGIGLTQARLRELADAGLDHVQLSLQGASQEDADRIGHYRGAHARKLAFAGFVNDVGIPLTLNVVCHRHNIDQVEDMIALAVRLGARRIEIATVQFHGWAERNRRALMPTRLQVERAAEVVDERRQALEGILVIDYVPADLYANFPKACMGGWGSSGLNVTPSGRVLPCHAAETITSLHFDTVRSRRLAEIWYDSDAFNAYRGEAWMQEPCRSCSRRRIDHGGCRCQALALAGNADAVDPVCIYSPHHEKIVAGVEQDAAAAAGDFVYRG